METTIPEGQPRSLYSAEELARGYSTNIKMMLFAYAAETVIVLTSLYGAYLFAIQYGNDDVNTIRMMMLAPIAFALVEFCRVPLAIAVRKPSYSLFLRLIIVLGLIGAAFVTIKSVSQLGEIMFRPRLFDVVHAKQKLAEAESAVELMKTQISDADAVVSQRQKELQTAEQEVTTASGNLAQIKGQECRETSGIGRNGRWKGMRCQSDPRVGSLTDAVKQATAHRDAALARLTEANTQRTAIDRGELESVLRSEQTKYREAVMHSQLHSFTAIFFGTEPTEVTDGQLHTFLRLFVFIPAIGAAFSATIIAFTAITRTPPTHVELADDAESFVLSPVVERIILKATEDHIRSLHDSVPPKPDGPQPPPAGSMNGAARPSH